jgi:hypothetical protein
LEYTAGSGAALEHRAVTGAYLVIASADALAAIGGDERA